MKENLNVTNLDQLREYAQGSPIELPGFGDDQPFVAMLRRPAMLVLAQQGKIPNPLLGQAAKMFAGQTSLTSGDADNFENSSAVLTVVAKASLASPTWEELEEIGLPLTDEQMIFIFNYAQQGVSFLNSFRKKP